MHHDIEALRDFYASRLGATTARLLNARIRTIWPHLSGMAVLGLGYAGPYLSNFQHDHTERLIAISPAAQGIHRWSPRDSYNSAALANETQLPLVDESFDRVLIVHALETSEETRGLLREVWRVLRPGGRILVVAPNRRGFWTYSDRTPFGHGQPYSRRQLDRLLTDHMFTPGTRQTALYSPPGLGLSLLTAIDRPGQKLWPRFGGVVLMEAEKRAYALSTPAFKRRFRVAPVMAPKATATKATNLSGLSLLCATNKGRGLQTDWPASGSAPMR